MRWAAVYNHEGFVSFRLREEKKSVFVILIHQKARGHNRRQRSGSGP